MIKKNDRSWKIIMIFLILLILAVIVFLVIRFSHREPKEIIKIFAENQESLDDPARGYYIQVQAGEYDRYQEMEEEGYRLALLAYDIKKYARQELTPEKLEKLRMNLEEAKKHHIKIIFRAAYGFWGDCEEPPVKEGFAGHIMQISEILNEYKDTVISVQAGMLGPYGEWHHGNYLSDDKEEEAANREIRQYILSMWEKYLDQSIGVAVRRPRFIREASEAGILTGRLGYHNDGLLGSDSDLGTYDDPEYDREGELEWMDKELAGQVNGGEMPIVCEWNDPVNADREFADMHITYLNRMYNNEIMDKWKEMEIHGQNAEKYIRDHLGYRLYIQEVTSYDYWKKGAFTLKFKIANSGYAALPERYKLYAVIKGNGTEIKEEVLNARLYQISNGEWAEIEIVMEIPRECLSQEEEGKWEFGIKIAETMDEADEKEWIKLANDEIKCSQGVYGLLTYYKEKSVYRQGLKE